MKLIKLNRDCLYYSDSSSFPELKKRGWTMYSHNGHDRLILDMDGKKALSLPVHMMLYYRLVLNK